MKSNSIISTLLLIFSSTLFGQLPMNVKGQIKWCEDSSPPKDIMVNLVINDSVAQTAFTDSNGNFTFQNFINTNAFSLKISYYGQILHITKFTSDTLANERYIDKAVSICCETISQEIKDSLFKNWNKHLLTIYYYGMSMYDDDKIRVFSCKYGVEYINLGCVAYYDEKEMNEKARSLLFQRLGPNWEDVFWYEIKNCYRN